VVALTPNVRMREESLTLINVLAYCCQEFIVSVKSFIEHAAEGKVSGIYKVMKHTCLYFEEKRVRRERERECMH